MHRCRSESCTPFGNFPIYHSAGSVFDQLNWKKKKYCSRWILVQILVLYLELCSLHVSGMGAELIELGIMRNRGPKCNWTISHTIEHYSFDINNVQRTAVRTLRHPNVLHSIEHLEHYLRNKKKNELGYRRLLQEDLYYETIIKYKVIHANKNKCVVNFTQ